MPLVHAYRRSKPHTVEVGGRKFTFAADAEGRQVFDIPEGPALTRLLEIADAYRLLGAPAPVLTSDDEDDDTPSPFVITVEGPDGNEMQVDLRTFDADKLRAFAAENEIPMPGTVKNPDTMRERIVKALNGTGEE